MFTILFFGVFPYNCHRTAMGVIPIFSYAPLWRTMEAKGISQYQLLKAGVDNRTLDSLKKGRNITMVTLARLCRILDCSPNEIVEIDKD